MVRNGAIALLHTILSSAPPKIQVQRADGGMAGTAQLSPFNAWA
ncbi:MAG: hypothetical protein AAFY26_15410 [Cyanobacteria bacterium J06638_22]